MHNVYAVMGALFLTCAGCAGGASSDGDTFPLESEGGSSGTDGATDTSGDGESGSEDDSDSGTDGTDGETGDEPVEPFDPNSVEMAVYWTSPSGTETDLAQVSYDNPADLHWITDGEGATQLEAPATVYFRHDQGVYAMQGGFRLLAIGESDTYAGAIHYRSAPGGMATFEISRFPEDNRRHVERYIHPGGISIGGEWYWKNPDDTSDPIDGWNKYGPSDSQLGRHVWLSEIAVVGQFSEEDDPRRDFGSLDIPYGSTGAQAPGTITGTQVYDKLTGGISIQATGSRVNNCLVHNSPKGSVSVSSAIVTSDIHIYGNLITNTGHSGPDGRDHFHNAYIQWRSNASGRLSYKHNILQFSAEEQAQFWAQGGVENEGQPDEFSKVDRIDLVENVLILGGTLNGQNYPGRSNRNSLIGGYTWDESITFVGNLSFHDDNRSAQLGYSDNWNNERRNMVVRDNVLVGESPMFQNVETISDISNNTIVVPNGRLLSLRLDAGHEDDYDNTRANQTNNHYYYGGDAPYVSKTLTGANGSGEQTPSFAQWQMQGTDQGSTASAGVPDNIIRVVSNELRSDYDSDWLGHFVIFNFSEFEVVEVDLSTLGLAAGDIFRVVDTQTVSTDLIGEFLFEAEYDPNNPVVEIPMDHVGAVPDPTGEMIAPYHSDRRFFCGLVYRTTAHDYP